MPDRDLNLRDLRRIVAAFNGWEDSGRGKGSHTMFFRKVGTSTFSYPIPTHDKTVWKKYIKGLRERLRLSPADGVSDEKFYNQ